MTNTTANVNYLVMGKINFSEGELAEGWVDDYEGKGIIECSDSGTKYIVFEGNDKVIVMVNDSGYGKPMASVYTKEVWKEIKNRMIK
jgi:hypothetical protein